MKTVLKILLIGLMINSTAKAQCITGMPNDTTICGFPGLTSLPITLGGNPILTSGISPFTYHWSTDLFWSPALSQNIDASFFLDDTTLANPILYSRDYFTGNEKDFYLTITGANGLSCTDTFSISVLLNFSYNLLECEIILYNPGDTAVLWTNIMDGIPPFTYSWSPPISISNVNTVNPLVYPDSSITYNLILTDSTGCQASSDCFVYVNPLTVEEIEHNKQLLKIVDILGKESKSKKGLLFYIYDDGTVEKKIIID